MTQAVRLLSKARSPTDEELSVCNRPRLSFATPDVVDPFSSPALAYTTTGTDAFHAPAAYPSRAYSWIHIYPEGRVHQNPRRTMRYFKWGIARLILEPDECPDIVPIWIEGYEQVYDEERRWPRLVPRLGKRLGIWFGENVAGEVEGPFAELRRRWKDLVERDRRTRTSSNEAGVADVEAGLGVLSEFLKYGKEAVDLRMECTREVRKQVLNLRRKAGLPDEDPKEGLVETWIEEGGSGGGRRPDGSTAKDR
jgi:monolysocardiolipin acyltransferase